MFIRNVHSKEYKGVTLDSYVALTSQYVDTKTAEFSRVAELLFDGYSQYSPEIKAALVELPEVKEYIKWADAYLKDSEEKFMQEFLPDDADDKDRFDCKSEWLDNAQKGAMDEWPTWRLYLGRCHSIKQAG